MEALLRRVEGGLPRIDRLTDIYNAISVKHLLPVGGEDLGEYRGPARLVRAAGDEPFDTVRDGQPVTEHPEPGEVVWRDDAGVTCRCWNWRQCVRTRITGAKAQSGSASTHRPCRHGPRRASRSRYPDRASRPATPLTADPARNASHSRTGCGSGSLSSTRTTPRPSLSPGQARPVTTTSGTTATRPARTSSASNPPARPRPSARGREKGRPLTS